MKIMFISDIHGIKTNLKLIKKKYDKFECEKLVVLGDLYYHDYNYRYPDTDNDYIFDFLKSFGDDLICMKGNCDTELDIKLSSFTFLRDLSLLYVDGLNIYITHGDKYSERNCQNLKNLKGIFVYGHEHRPYIYEQGKFVYINTGSISLPRGTEKASYTIYDNRKFTIYDVEGKIINSISI